MTTPTIVPRAEWGAAPLKCHWTAWPVGQPTGHTIHWEGAGGHPDHAMCPAEVRAIQAYEQSKDYCDVAYNWLVCNHGVIFEGRPAVPFESAAQLGGNPLRVAVCYIGGPNFPFTPAAQASIAWLLNTHDPGATLGRAIGHRDEPTCNTQCPGDTIESWVKSKAWGTTPITPSPQPQPTPAPLPLPPHGVHHPVLAKGAVGPAVIELQRKLDAVAGSRLTQDGKYGPLTFNAVVTFQRFFKLTPDGVAGPQTWGMLDYCCALHGVH